MVNFDEYSYYPSLRTRMWELRGYRELDAADKDSLLPIFTISKHARTVAASAVFDVLTRSTEGRNHILDLESNPIFACSDVAQLLDPTNAFSNWRDFVEARDNVVPTALIPTSAPLRDIVRQVVEFERLDRQVVLRSRNPLTDIPVISAILSAVDSVSNLLIILDFGYIRSSVSLKAREAANAINAIRNVEDSARIVVLGSSYPRSAAAYDDVGATLEIEERTLHETIGGNPVAIYGDYASIHPEPFEAGASRFVPRIDYVTPNAWIFRRIRENLGGFTECARRITALQDWDDTLVPQVWGARKINDAANGDIDSMGTPGPWIAARVNQHLWQQMRYQEAPTADDFDEF